MTQIIKKISFTYFVLGIVLIFSVNTAPLYAQQSQVLSVTPPLFQLSAEPGDIWQSSVKVVNSNPYPLTVYAEVVNFKPTGELGQGAFLPILAEDVDKTTLAHWIQIVNGPHTILAEQTKEISFFAEIPANAPPGGHYAAIMISTEPPREKDASLAVQTMQTVTSLFFVRIEGDVDENGTIREFKVLDRVIPKPEAEFSLRFENKGNVHLQPRGNIIITNMWGTERGVVPVNYQTHFGNVLPESIRDFKFAWQSDFSITDVGRYKAVVTLAYGEDGVKSVSSVTYFWVIPIKITLITLAVIAGFIALVVAMVRLYVRKMLVLAGVNPDRQESTPLPSPKKAISLKVDSSYTRVSAPIREGVLDLRTRLSKVDESLDVFGAVTAFVLHYKIFFLSILILIGIFISTVLYIGKATQDHANYRVIIDEGDSETTLQGADIESSLDNK